MSKKRKSFVLGADVEQALRDLISINDEPEEKEDKAHEHD